MAPTRDAVDAFLTDYGRSLVAYDAVATAHLWGVPGTVVSDSFVGAVATREQMAVGLTGNYPLYRALGLGGISHDLIEFTPLTDVLVRTRVRWDFLDNNGAFLTDSTYEYVLRQDDDGLHVYVSIGIDGEAKLRELARGRGIDLPDRPSRHPAE